MIKDSRFRDNVVAFEQPKAKSDDDGIGEDWLKSLPAFTVFVGKLKNNPKSALKEFHVIYHANTLTRLAAGDMNDGQGSPHEWVNSLQFSRTVDLVEIIRHGSDKLPEEGDNHDKRDPDQSGQHVPDGAA